MKKSQNVLIRKLIAHILQLYKYNLNWICSWNSQISIKEWRNWEKSWRINFDELYSEAVVQGCSVKKVFLEISQNSQENTCARVSFLIKLQAEACNFI